MTMNKRIITQTTITEFDRWLQSEERSAATREKYIHGICTFSAWIKEAWVTKESVVAWKALLAERYAPSTVNTLLAALNSFFQFIGWNECRMGYLKVQHRLFRDPKQELTKNEYARLIMAARENGKERIALLMETICATGIRVSEVRYITVQAAQCGRAEVSLKGKIRTILIPNKLCRKLLKYAKRKKITCGEIFLTTGGKSINRRQIWAEMKQICKLAGVEADKVFPHNLRHLFATAYYRAYKDIVKLADMLGHSSLETTRIYLLTSGKEHQRQMERLGLIT